MPTFQEQVSAGIPRFLPTMPEVEANISHAPTRPRVLNPTEAALAVKNALQPAMAGVAVPLLPGSYAELRRAWRPGPASTAWT